MCVVCAMNSNYKSYGKWYRGTFSLAARCFAQRGDCVTLTPVWPGHNLHMPQELFWVKHVADCRVCYPLGCGMDARACY